MGTVSVRKDPMAANRTRKLAIISTWATGSATLACSPTGLHLAFIASRRRASPLRLQCSDGDIGILRTVRRDVREAAARIVDQQQVDALALQAVVVVQALGVDQRDVDLAVLGDDLLGTGLERCRARGPGSSSWRSRACLMVKAGYAPIVTFSRLPFRWYLKRQVFEPDGMTSGTRPPPSVRS
jgi:hypothetical protein